MRVLELLNTSKMAVDPRDNTLSPAAIWKCVAAGLPIVVNERIKGGKQVVVPGVTWELATEDTFYEVMMHGLSNLDDHRPRAYFEEHWNTLTWLEKYLSFFYEMGWNRTTPQMLTP
ncbi:MAG: hypothetical protein O7F12_02185 [Nitrospirae bacterium]|nr:hypothetical protein [Nitrospirota bacterium]